MNEIKLYTNLNRDTYLNRLIAKNFYHYSKNNKL